MPTLDELRARKHELTEAPKDDGPILLLVRRPAEDEREVLTAAEVAPGEGLRGDDWCRRPSSLSADGGPHPEKQLTLMNVRMIRMLTASEDEWPTAGDQVFVDMDLSHDNLPVGTRLALGDAEVEVSEAPHKGCKKFARRFGEDAFRFVHSAEGRAIRARGLNARVVRAGSFRVGDAVRKLD